MAIQWMDDFTSYGTNAGLMLNGPYAELSWVSLTADPDPTAGGKTVLTLSPNSTSTFRKVLNGPQTVVGVAARYWLTSLPDSTNRQPRFAQVADTSNNTHCFVTCNPSGYFQAYRSDSGGDVLLGQSVNPVVIADAWRHVETQFALDAVNGSIEVRLEGVTVLKLTNIKTITNTSGSVGTAQNVKMGMVAFGALTGAPTLYVKDFIIWDGTTSVNNAFMGSCQVYKLLPDADVTMPWGSSAGGPPTLNAPSTSTTGGTLAAGTYYYKVSAITPSGETLPSNEVSQVTTGTTSSNTLTWTSVSGATGYKIYRGTTAGGESVYYTVGNVLTYTDTNAASTAGTPLTSLVGYNLINEISPDDDAKFISAPFPLPAPAQFSLSDLPNNVTSVRGVMVMHRSRKVDGGDGNLQVSVVSGVNTGNGADRTITTAYTYWWDLFDQDPSGTNWNKTLVNALNLKLNRTV